MSKLIGIVAMTTNGIIAVNDKLPVKSKYDMRFFKSKTENNIVIMGKKTYETLGKPLPNRLNIVLTKTPMDNIGAHERPYYTDSIIKALRHRGTDDTRDTYIIGGRQVYQSMIPICDELYVTVFDNMQGLIYEDNITTFPYSFNVHHQHTESEKIGIGCSLLDYFNSYEVVDTFIEESGVSGRIFNFSKG